MVAVAVRPPRDGASAAPCPHAARSSAREAEEVASSSRRQVSSPRSGIGRSLWFLSQNGRLRGRRWREDRVRGWSNRWRVRCRFRGRRGNERRGRCGGPGDRASTARRPEPRSSRREAVGASMPAVQRQSARLHHHHWFRSHAWHLPRTVQLVREVPQSDPPRDRGGRRYVLMELCRRRRCWLGLGSRRGRAGRTFGTTAVLCHRARCGVVRGACPSMPRCRRTEGSSRSEQYANPTF